MANKEFFENDKIDEFNEEFDKAIEFYQKVSLEFEKLLLKKAFNQKKIIDIQKQLQLSSSFYLGELQTGYDLTSYEIDQYFHKPVEQGKKIFVKGLPDPIPFLSDDDIHMEFLLQGSLMGDRNMDDFGNGLNI